MASKRSSGGSVRRVTIPVEFRGHDCGSIAINLTALQQGITNELTRLFSQAMSIARAYSTEHTEPQEESLDARAAGDYVSQRVEQVCNGLIDDALSEWFVTRKSNADLLVESAVEDPDYHVFQVLIKRAIASGSVDNRRQPTKALAKSLGQSLSFKRGPKARSPYDGLDWVRDNLARVESAVKAARRSDPDDCDYALLGRLFRELLSSTRFMSLIAEVRLCRRRHRAVELLVGRKLGVGTDQARQIIALVKQSRSKNAPEFPSK